MDGDPVPNHGLSRRDERRRARHLVFWRLINPVNRTLAPLAPWWVVLETRRRSSGAPRRTPLARGPVESGATWLISVHGRRALWVRDLEADPRVRIRLRGRWRSARASVEPYDPTVARRFNRYARLGPRLMGIEPLLVRIGFERSEA